MNGRIYCFDARKIDDSGIGRYIRLLLNGLLAIDSENGYLIVLPPTADPGHWEEIANVRIIREDARNYSLRELTWMSYRLWKQKPYLVHEPHYAGPWIRPWKTVVTIQDIIHLKFPEYHRGFARTMYVPAMLKRSLASDRIIVSSESTRRDLIGSLKADPNRIRVTPYAADPIFRPPESLSQARDIAAGYGLHKNYLMYVGMWKAHKNLGALLRVFRQVVAETGWDGLLAIVGRPDSNQSQIHQLTTELGLAERVVFTGFVPDGDLSGIYGAATALVHPSLYEGFGLTILESMACGAPVIAVRSSSVPEVSGDAAILTADAGPDLFRAITSVIKDETLRKKLRIAGLERAKAFSWERTARATLGVYEEI